MTDTLLINATLFDPRAGTLTTGVAVRIAEGVVRESSVCPECALTIGGLGRLTPISYKRHRFPPEVLTAAQIRD